MRQQSAGYVLKFISGKYQGGEFALEWDKELLIGRSSDLEMVLVEDMVSRRHARITTFNGEVWIEDLSTNGTFVNGEKITKVRLKEGDRILIGTNIIKLVYEEHMAIERDIEPAPQQPAPGRNRHGNETRGASHTRATNMGVLQGQIDMVPLPDLLQLFGSSRKSGCLIIDSEGMVGRVFLKEGRVYGATIDDEVLDQMEKAFYRMMAWTTGNFLLDANIEEHFENPLDYSVESLMMEGMRILDEIHNLGPEVPELSAYLELSIPLIPPLRSLTPELLDTLQLAYNHRQVSKILDASASTDLETLQDLVYLIKNDYLKKVSY